MELAVIEERRADVEQWRRERRLEAAAQEVARQRRLPVVQCRTCGWFFPRWEIAAGAGGEAHECLGCAGDVAWR